MNITDSDFTILKKIDREIDNYFKRTYSIKEVRSTDIYAYIEKKEALGKMFPTGDEFNHFLRKMETSGLLKSVIPNVYVDTSNPKFYQWRFYRKEIKKSNTVNSESRISDSKHFKRNKNVPVNNGDFVRSKQEQYIYNRLLNEDFFLIYYERKLKNKYPDFTIVNKNTNVVYIWEHFGMTDFNDYMEKIDERIYWFKELGYRYIEEGGRLVITYYKDEIEFKNDVERVIELIKAPGTLS